MSTEISAADVIDATSAVGGQAQAKADKAAVRFDKIAADIAEFGAFVRANPNLAEHLSNTLDGQRVLAYVYDAETIAQFARAAARAGRKVAKKPGGTNDQYFGIEVSFGWLRLYVYGIRDLVCERVVVGTETVTHEVPDPELLAQVPTVTVTETVEQVEWRCGSLLAPPPALEGGGSDA